MGPLRGLTVVEMAGIGPCPFAGMLLADLGASVIRIDRTAEAGLGIAVPPHLDLMNRGKKSIAIDLKSPEGVALALHLISRADAVMEGFRPGVMERMGLGSDVCLEKNPALVYGRITGWGQDGPLAKNAGHDINYIALTGVLSAIGSSEKPMPPLNLVGDFGGGAMFLVVGMLAALLEARQSGQGQVVDAAIVDGVAVLATMFNGLLAGGLWNDKRHSNLLDGGIPWYDCYTTLDGKHIAVGALEGKFYDQMVERLGFQPGELPDRNKPSNWPVLRQRLAERIATRTRDEWSEIMAGFDACVAPVLTWDEAASHPHNAERGTYARVDGINVPAPAPRFSRTEAASPSRPCSPGDSSVEILTAAGLDAAEIRTLIGAGVVAANDTSGR